MAQNWFATLALVSWPLVTVWLYRAKSAGVATLWTILGAQLVLPTNAFIKFEMIPQFDKISIPNLAALAVCLLIGRMPFRFWKRFGVAEVLLLMYLVSPFITAELNTDPIILVNNTLPAATHYDALSAIVAQFIFLIPFFIGRELLVTPEDNLQILRVLVIAGLIYSVPMLFEVRFSPQLHTWVYGYFPHVFDQQVRYGGYRPVVFMLHGLMVAFFAATTTVAAAALWRTRTRVQRLAPAGVTAYLFSILVLCKSAGALMYGAILVPLVRFTKPRLQLRIAVIFVSIGLLYPVLRYADLVPTQSITEIVKMVSDDRAGSLESRFNQEKKLLDHASARFLFGWGRWGRSHVYHELDGRVDLSIPDGGWIISMGVYGFFGFLAQFGLLAFPVFCAASALRLTESLVDQVTLAALALIVAINVVDLIPNEFLTPWAWLLAGALLGRAEALRSVSVSMRTRYPLKINFQKSTRVT